jgi:hypothetical protein
MIRWAKKGLIKAVGADITPVSESHARVTIGRLRDRLWALGYPWSF